MDGLAMARIFSVEHRCRRHCKWNSDSPDPLILAPKRRHRPRVGNSSPAIIAVLWRSVVVVFQRTHFSFSQLIQLRAASSVNLPGRSFDSMVGQVGTHDGKFHCDEVFACFMIKRLNQFRDYTVVRTRDSATLEKCDVVVDVGGVYDHLKRRYDHHQRQFNETMQTLGVLDFNTKLSSAGLVYAHYGKQLIAEIIGSSHEDKLVGILYRKLYESFVEAIDAIDNGIPQYDGTPRYHIFGGLSERVGFLNPHWNEVNCNPDERFQQAMELVGGEFESAVSYLANVWWPAREIVEKAIDECLQADSSGRIVLLTPSSVPWKEHLFQIEEEKNLSSRKLTYMVYEDSTSRTYRVQAIPKDKFSMFENRMPLPKAWRGLRDDELSTISGITGCVFVHASGFIGGNRTLEGALMMARKAIEIGDAAECDEETMENGADVKRKRLDQAEHLLPVEA
ncbi:hypothetical protein KIN20_034413 [Parelaphostrongylus tenuis]|uniref:Uncharacterized protein n=1 Tax=Parelaphostrongylus tenuis TaxID=148309 RepID=A0AAD5RA06_PARTN|nr:hypothetical protein KIN20_034413 [Parelaphostrongylus tenuis]